MRICGSYFECKGKDTAPVESLEKKIILIIILQDIFDVGSQFFYLIWVDDKLEVEEVVHIGELCFAGFWKLQFVQVLKYKVLT